MNKPSMNQPNMNAQNPKPQNPDKPDGNPPYERHPGQFDLLSAALAFGAGGLIPFAALGAGTWFATPEASALMLRHLCAYGAVILAFVGALHWGFAMLARMDDFERPRVLGWSVVPALTGWVALILPLRAGLIVLIVMFLAHYAMDLRLARLASLPPWYLKLRLWLTLGACLGLAAGALR